VTAGCPIACSGRLGADSHKRMLPNAYESILRSPAVRSGGARRRNGRGVERSHSAPIDRFNHYSFAHRTTAFHVVSCQRQAAKSIVLIACRTSRPAIAGIIKKFLCVSSTGRAPIPALVCSSAVLTCPLCNNRCNSCLTFH